MSDNEATRGHRPCPFDGLDALTYFATPLGDGWIRCTICGTAGPMAENETEAWRRWDERKIVTANVDQSREAFEREYNAWYSERQYDATYRYVLTPFQQAFNASIFLNNACEVASEACHAGLIPSYKDRIEIEDIDNVNDDYIRFRVRRSADDTEDFTMPCHAVYDRQAWFDELAEKQRTLEELVKLKADQVAAQKARAVEEEERLQLARLQEKYGR
jgi:hypothetical protein